MVPELPLLRSSRATLLTQIYSLIPWPDEFNGNCQWFWDFINQFHCLVMMHPHSCNTDNAKVSLVISPLSGEALYWVYPFLEHDSQCYRTGKSFSKTWQYYLTICTEPKQWSFLKEALIRVGCHSLLFCAILLPHAKTNWNEVEQVYQFW
uniref:DUF4939 domain-containing protein n=1 Tax=Pelusios castaneus TaxID=367368 RepID=A0A8C8RLS7_9SAUR